MKHESHEWFRLTLEIRGTEEYMCHKCAACTCCSNPVERNGKCTEEGE